MKKLLYIIGAGPGIAQGVAEKFGSEGYEIVLFARNEARLQTQVASLHKAGISASYYLTDAGQTDNLRISILKAVSEKGSPTILHYNAASMKMVNILEESADSLVADFRLTAANALTAVKAVKDSMKGNPDATILLTGGGFAMYPSSDFGSLSVGKAAVRNLGQSLFRALKVDGIHVGTVTVCGMVSADDAKYSPKAIAEQFWKLHNSREEYEIVY